MSPAKTVARPAVAGGVAVPCRLDDEPPLGGRSMASAAGCTGVHHPVA